MRIPSGVTDQYVYFVAVDATDFATRETGLSIFTVYRSRNGAAAAAMTTPTINEVDASNMPGVYELLLDEDMTIAAGNDSEDMVFHITHAGMHPVSKTIELYRPKITAGNTLDVTATGAAGIDWGNVENQATSVSLDTTTVALVSTTGFVSSEISANVTKISGDATAANNAELAFDGTGYGFTNCTMPTVTTLTGHTPQTGDTYADWANGGRLDLILDAILAMLDAARAEPGQGAPPVNADAMTKLDYLYKAWRNKTLQSATEYKLYNDAGDTIDQKATVSDDGTDFTRGEVGTGA